MNDATEEEARRILAGPFVCEDCGEWTPSKSLNGLHETGCGLLGEDGVNLRLYVDMKYRRTEKTDSTHYMFTMFKRQPYGPERVYQLDVRQYPIVPRDAHSLPHEHIGNSRVTGDASWSKWTYDEVMAYFCRQANIEFRPTLPHPEEFRLKRQ